MVACLAASLRPSAAAETDALRPAGGLEYFPAAALYSPYVADPQRAGFGLLLMSVPDVAIPDSGDQRVGLRIGGRLGLLGIGTEEQPGSWQLSLDAGFSGQFDADHSLDNIGWDGIYGLTFAWAVRPDLQMKVGTMHWSSHVGDEYAERTGRRRIGYTRGELLAGTSWWFADRWRAYADYGHAYDYGNEELQQPGRAQGGIEFDSTRAGMSGRYGWYAAVDVAATEEREWERDSAVQVGYVIHAEGRRWRFGVEYYRGRPPIGEFFQLTETYLSLGVWMEL
jgi:hypothetical protein